MAGQVLLQLTVTGFVSPTQWRWELHDAGGAPVDDHDVQLNAGDPMYAAMLDLPAYLSHNAAPDRRRQDETRIIGELGEWMGRNVMGRIAPAILSQGTPATVRVLMPPEAAGLLGCPLELAHAAGRPLAVQDVSLVFELQGEYPRVVRSPVSDRLRMLAVFSVPTDVRALSLRRERYELKRFIHELTATRGLAIDLRVLQYGATRQALKDALEEGEGWDIVHFSGHGLRAHLVLENLDGLADVIPSDRFADLLKPARGRLKLVTLSACYSAAATVRETALWLGIELPPQLIEAEEDAASAEEADITAVARALVEATDCAVLAMRYPVGDEFAISLCKRIYNGMFRQGQSLPRALQLALPGLTQGGGTAEPLLAPPLAVATPSLHGRRGVGLEIKAPPAPAGGFPEGSVGLAYFPREPERFVGRVEPMTRASRVLAPRSGQTAVLFYGMAGGGKTACALEVAYHHEAKQRFQGFVWYKAPEEGRDIAGSLQKFALAMEKRLPGFKMVHVVGRAEQFRDWLPQLRQFLTQNSVLIVLDNLETLLKPHGGWRDECWGDLIAAMTGHNGVSRTILTSRRKPAGLGGREVLVESVHALSLSESLLLAREFPNLGKLLRSPCREKRRVVVRALKVVQGHPKLLDLAEGQARDADTLEQHVERAEDMWQRGQARIDAFFAEGVSQVKAKKFLSALADWTRSVAAAMPDATRVLFSFLCALEESDRRTGVLKPVWPDLWKRLELLGEPPDLAETLEPLTAAGLVDADEVEPGACLYRLHPGVAEAGRKDSGEDFQGDVDAELSGLWMTEFARGREKEMEGGGALMVSAALSASPYLLRLEQWSEASRLLESAIGIDDSPETIATVLPGVRRIVEETAGTETELQELGILAKALDRAGQWGEAEAMLRDLVRKSSEQGEFHTAAAATSGLINILRRTGRAEEALKLVDGMKEYTRRAGMGPWTQLSDEAVRLQLLNWLGRYEEVLSEVEKLRRRMDELPEESKEEEAVSVWNVREVVLDTGRAAALRLKQWETALSLNAEIVAITEARGAPELDLARTRFRDYGPLLRLRQYEGAQELLSYGRRVFEAADDVPMLGKAFTAMADLEHEQGHYEQAIRFEETALRYAYQGADPEACAISHNNLANYMRRGGVEQRPAVAHTLAAGLIRVQTGSGLLVTVVHNLAIEFAVTAPELPQMPGSFDEVCDMVEQIEGVRFRELFERLPRSAAQDGDEAMRIVIEKAQNEANELAKQESKQGDAAASESSPHSGA